MNINDHRLSIFSRYEMTDILAILAFCFTIILWASQSAGRNAEHLDVSRLARSSSPDR